MRVEAALCQIRPVAGNPGLNAEKIAGLLMSDSADILIFPESFLTGYGVDPEGLSEEIDESLRKISDLCRKYDKAAVIGTNMMTQNGAVNSIAFLSPDGDTYYDKAHLARFGIYSENGFAAGRKPAMGSYHGLRFGLCICYDIYFPEILHGCSLRRADVNICVSAAAVQSAQYFDKVLPARALENVTYLAFVNNVGMFGELEMAGTSRGLDPLGNVIADCGTEECISRFAIDTEELTRMRGIRRHLTEFRHDIAWLP